MNGSATCKPTPYIRPATDPKARKPLLSFIVSSLHGHAIQKNFSHPREGVLKGSGWCYLSIQNFSLKTSKDGAMYTCSFSCRRVGLRQFHAYRGSYLGRFGPRREQMLIARTRSQSSIHPSLGWKLTLIINTNLHCNTLLHQTTRVFQC